MVFVSKRWDGLVESSLAHALTHRFGKCHPLITLAEPMRETGGGLMFQVPSGEADWVRIVCSSFVVHGDPTLINTSDDEAIKSMVFVLPTIGVPKN